MKNHNYTFRSASKQNLLYKELLKVLRELDVRIKIETGTFLAGLYSIDGEMVFRQHKNTKINKKTAEILEYLKTIDLSNVELPLIVKEHLQEAV